MNMAYRSRRDDDGVTLIEMIVVVVVAGLFVGLIAITLVNGLQSQQRATARDNATGQANAAAAALQSSVRNAAAFRISESGTRLDAAVAIIGTDLEWECRAFKLSGGDLYYSVGSAPRPADLVSGRQPIVQGVTATLASSAAFAQGTGTADAQRRVQIGMTVTTGDQSITLDDAVTAQVVVQGGAPPCW